MHHHGVNESSERLVSRFYMRLSSDAISYLLLEISTKDDARTINSINCVHRARRAAAYRVTHRGGRGARRRRRPRGARYGAHRLRGRLMFGLLCCARPRLPPPPAPERRAEAGDQADRRGGSAAGRLGGAAMGPCGLLSRNERKRNSCSVTMRWLRSNTHISSSSRNGA